MKSVIVALLYFVHLNGAITLPLKERIKKGGLENFALGYAPYGFGTSEDIYKPFIGTNIDSIGWLNEIDWPVSTDLLTTGAVSLNKATGFGGDTLQWTYKNTGTVTIPQAVLPAPAIREPAPVTTEAPEPVQPTQVPLRESRSGSGTIGGGSLGYVNLGNGGYAVGTGSLGFAAVQPSQTSSTSFQNGLANLQQNFAQEYPPPLNFQFVESNQLSYPSSQNSFNNNDNNGYSGGNFLEFLSNKLLSKSR